MASKGERSHSTVSAPSLALKRLPSGQWGAVPVWVMRRLRGHANAVHAYAWLQARYGHPANTEIPTREQCAHDTGMSVSTWQRAIDTCRRRGVLETTRRRDHNGTVVGLSYTPITVEPGDEPAEPSLSVTGDTQPSLLNVTGDTQMESRQHPECQIRGGLSVTRDTHMITTDQYRSDQGGVVDLRGSKQQAANPPTPAEQQHGPPKDPDPDPDTGPTVDGLLRTFYVLWAVTHGAPCDPRPKDPATMAEMVARFGYEAVLEAIPLFFKCADERIVGPRDRLHPLGFLAANLGWLLATARQRAPDQDVWAAICGRIRQKTNANTFHTWFAPTRLAAGGDQGATLLIETPSSVFEGWILKHLANVMREAADEIRPGVAIQFVSVEAPRQAAGRMH